MPSKNDKSKPKKPLTKEKSKKVPTKEKVLKAAEKPPKEVRTPSRQREYQKRRIAEGKCQRCGKLRNLYATVCDVCHDKLISYVRDKKGYDEWQPGGRGRPPKNQPKKVKPRNKKRS